MDPATDPAKAPRTAVALGSTPGLSRITCPKENICIVKYINTIIENLNTVKPVSDRPSRERENVVVIQRWSLYTGGLSSQAKLKVRNMLQR